MKQLIIDKSYPNLKVIEMPEMNKEFFAIYDPIETSGTVKINLDKPLFIAKGIKSSGSVYSNTKILYGGPICVNGELKSNSDIDIFPLSAFTEESKPLSITVGKDIVVDGELSACGDITVGGSLIVSGSIINVDGDIIVGGGIRTGKKIVIRGDIDCKKRIFVGLQANATSKRCKNRITCNKLKNGEVCYGDLFENEGHISDGKANHQK